jgi:hypothetical protein
MAARPPFKKIRFYVIANKPRVGEVPVSIHCKQGGRGSGYHALSVYGTVSFKAPTAVPPMVIGTV